MKTIKEHDDGIDWLRKLRHRIAARCGKDLARQSDLYHQAAAKHSYKSYKWEAAVTNLAGRKLQKPRKRIG
jgi:hypothetical protein